MSSDTDITLSKSTTGVELLAEEDGVVFFLGLEWWEVGVGLGGGARKERNGDWGTFPAGVWLAGTVGSKVLPCLKEVELGLAGVLVELTGDVDDLCSCEEMVLVILPLPGLTELMGVLDIWAEAGGTGLDLRL